MRRWFSLSVVAVLATGCATDYSRRLPAAEDPSDPAAPAGANATVALYQSPATADVNAPDAGTNGVPEGGR